MIQAGDHVRLLKEEKGTGVPAGEIGFVIDVYQPYEGLGIDWLYEVEFRPKGIKDEISLSVRVENLEKV